MTRIDNDYEKWAMGKAAAFEADVIRIKSSQQNRLEPSSYVEREWLLRLRHKLVIADGVVLAYTEKSKPNRWHRFWYRVLLGWRWEDIEREGND